MIDISKGRFWDLPLSLIDGCTPCSPGCDNCWSAGMTHRFEKKNGWYDQERGFIKLTANAGKFTGQIIFHPERLSIPLKRRKPTVYCIWNDIFHEAVPTEFIDDVLEVMAASPQHTFLVLTKRAHLMEEKIYGVTSDHGFRELGGGDYLPNVYWGLTVCNQDEADEKIPVFLQVQGKKFLSIEPMLGPVELVRWMECRHAGDGFARVETPGLNPLQGVILGGETGPGARPMHPDWVRSVRDQCAAAGVPFFFKQWGEWAPKSNGHVSGDGRWGTITASGEWFENTTPWNGHDDDGSGEAIMIRVGRNSAGRLLDGRTRDDLLWRAEKKDEC